METFKQLNKFTKSTLVAGLILIIYGYLCRIVGLYFFWESKSIGWTLLFIGVIGILSNRIKIKSTEKKKTLIAKIGIGIIIFILLAQSILIAVMPFTNAYSVAKIFLINDSTLKTELGEINGIGLISTGSFERIIDPNGEYGIATINLTLKGDKKFKDITIYVVKSPESPEWKVEGIE